MSLLDVFNKPDREYRYGDGLLAPKPDEQRQGPGLLAGGAPQSSGQDIDPIYGLPKAIVEQYQRQDRMSQLFGGITQLAGAFSRNPQHQQQAMQMGQQMATGTAPERLQQLSQMRNAYMQQQQQQQVMQSLPAIAQQTGIPVQQLQALAASGKLGEALKSMNDPFTVGNARFTGTGRQIARADNYQAMQQDGQLTGVFDPATGRWQSPEAVGAPSYTPPRQTANVADGGTLVDTRTGEAIYQSQPKQPNDVREYEYARGQGYQGTFDQFQQTQRRAGATNVNVGAGTDQQAFNFIKDSYDAANTASKGNVSLDEAERAVRGSAITGAGADQKLWLQKAGAAFGVGDTKAITDTEAFRAAIAPQVAATLRSTVGSTQISDADRRFAEAAAGGSITLDRSSILRLIDIQRRANNALIDQHNQRVDAAYPGDNPGLQRERKFFRIEAPKPVPPAQQFDMSGAQNAPQPQARQQQSQSGTQEGATATNPQTGERIVFRNGRWEPAR